MAMEEAVLPICRGDTVTVFRGDSSRQVGEAGITRIARNGATVQAVTIGTPGYEPEFDLVFEREIPIQPSDTLVFECPRRTKAREEAMRRWENLTTKPTPPA